MLEEQVCVSVSVCACRLLCVSVFVWDKQIFVPAGRVVQAVGRTAQRAEGPNKTLQYKLMGTEHTQT